MADSGIFVILAISRVHSVRGAYMRDLQTPIFRVWSIFNHLCGLQTSSLISLHHHRSTLANPSPFEAIFELCMCVCFGYLERENVILEE